MSYEVYLQEVRQFLLKLIVAKLEERVLDKSITVVLNDFIVEAIESIAKIDSVVEGSEDDKQDMFDEIVIECFAKIEGFTDDSELATLFSNKRFNDQMSGSEFLAFLKGAN